MGELPPFVPREFNSATGNFAQDLAETIGNHDTMAAERLEAKRQAYAAETDIIAQAAVELADQEFSHKGMDTLDVTNMRVELLRAAKAAVKAKLAEPAGREMFDKIYLHNTQGEARQDLSEAAMTSLIMGNITVGIIVAMDVITSYWETIKRDMPEDGDFFAIAGSKKSMNTLVQMTLAWHLDELRARNEGLGSTFDDYTGGGPSNDVMPHEYFVVDHEGIALSESGQEYFTVDPALADTKVGCPAGFAGTAENNGKTEHLIPVKRIAEVFLQKAQDTL